MWECGVDGALHHAAGLGHLLGIDTHDVGGYGKGFPPRSERPGLKSLRLGRPLLENMVLTVEPGIYFNPALLKPALKTNQSRFLVKSVLSTYYDFGGALMPIPVRNDMPPQGS